MFLKRYYWAINLALITLVVWASVQLLVACISAKLDLRPLPRPSTSVAVPREPRDKPRSYFDPLAAHSVFDPYGEGHVAPPPEPEPVYVPPPPPPLSSKVRLRGTVAGDVGFGLAILDDMDQRRPEVVKIGGRVGAAVLVSVGRNSAVFEVGGRRETLTLTEDNAAASFAGGQPAFRPSPNGFSRSRSQGPPEAGPPGARPNVGYRPTGAGAAVVTALGPTRFAVNRQELNSLAGEPDRLNAEVTTSSVGGGLLISDTPPGGLAERAGLRGGDVVKSINGTRVVTPAEAMQAWQKAQSGPSMRVEVERDSRTRILTYELR
ncbi:MAG: PDZ domain-containing protein [Pseudomonadota bacterium]